MKENFIDIIRIPDDVKVMTEASPIRFEENGYPNPSDARVEFEVSDALLKVILCPSNDAVQWLRLRFDGEQRGVCAVMGDSFARCSADDIVWKSFMPHERMPWYFQAFDGVRLNCYGVRTGCNSFAYWQADPFGITLWLDVRNGGGGISLTEPLVCAEVVCRKGNENETPYQAASDFCRMMCPRPNLPKTPVFGFNNWYWAYGGIDETTVLHEAEYLSRFTDGCEYRPYMVIDDGWQINHSLGYNGGPWNKCNESFSSMEETAVKITERGCLPGIWIRTLLTMKHVPKETVYSSPSVKFGTVLDPSHPYTLEHTAENISRLADWGYKLIKHDFSTYDLFGSATGVVSGSIPKHFYDKTKTNAQIITELYRTIQRSAGSALVIGCDTVNHLAAGIHQIQRIGGDTSGRSFEHTRRDGIHSLMRLPQNMAFFKIDPDCSAFTEKVSKPLNFDYMEASAICGCAVFASVKPGILTSDEEKRLNGILKIASNIKSDEYAVPNDWTRTGILSEFCFKGSEYVYNWYSEYKGARTVLTWLE